MQKGSCGGSCPLFIFNIGVYSQPVIGWVLYVLEQRFSVLRNVEAFIWIGINKISIKYCYEI
jgi:hypothetical protein